MSKYRAVVKAVEDQLKRWDKPGKAGTPREHYYKVKGLSKGMTVFVVGNEDVRNVPEAVIRIEDETNLGGGIVYHSEIAYEDGPQFFFGLPDFHKLTSRGTMDQDVTPNKAKRLTRALVQKLDILFDPVIGGASSLSEIKRLDDEYSEFVASIRSRRQESLRKNPAASSVGSLFVAGLLGYAIAKRSR